MFGIDFREELLEFEDKVVTFDSIFTTDKTASLLYRYDDILFVITIQNDEFLMFTFDCKLFSYVDKVREVASKMINKLIDVFKTNDYTRLLFITGEIKLLIDQNVITDFDKYEQISKNDFITTRKQEIKSIFKPISSTSTKEFRLTLYGRESEKLAQFLMEESIAEYVQYPTERGVSFYLHLNDFRLRNQENLLVIRKHLSNFGYHSVISKAG
jgi:hypothetical protein